MAVGNYELTLNRCICDDASNVNFFPQIKKKKTKQIGLINKICEVLS